MWLSVVKIIELVGSSRTSSDDAVQQALNEARATLRNIKGVDVISVGLRGDDSTNGGRTCASPS